MIDLSNWYADPRISFWGSIASILAVLTSLAIFTTRIAMKMIGKLRNQNEKQQVDHAEISELLKISFSFTKTILLSSLFFSTVTLIIGSFFGFALAFLHIFPSGTPFMVANKSLLWFIVLLIIYEAGLYLFRKRYPKMNQPKMGSTKQEIVSRFSLNLILTTSLWLGIFLFSRLFHPIKDFYDMGLAFAMVAAAHGFIFGIAVATIDNMKPIGGGFP